MVTKVVNNVPNFAVNATVQKWTRQGWDFTSDSVSRTVMSRKHTLIFTKELAEPADPDANRAAQRQDMVEWRASRSPAQLAEAERAADRAAGRRAT